jgi:glycosyltransferase involved in cell wall biosynthesis
MNRGGLETMIMNYYRSIDREKIQFDFLVHRNEKAYYDDEIESLGGKIYHISRLNPFSKSYKNALKNFLLNHPEYKIIHVHQDCLSGVILKVAKECGVPVRIAHSHNSNQDKNLKYLIKLYYKRIIPKYSTHLFACGKKAGEWMFSGAKFDILNNAIEAEKYTFSQEKRNQMRTALNIPDNKLVIGHVGRFSEPKNHCFLIKIFAEILKNRDALLLLVGDGELRPNIEAQAKQLGIYDKILFLGRRNDVYDVMQAMDVFVFPSLYEGLGIVVIEAQASGLPCLISNEVPTDAMLTDSVWQLPLNVLATLWAQKINELKTLNRNNTLKQIKNHGYDIDDNVTELENFYLKLWS